MESRRAVFRYGKFAACESCAVVCSEASTFRKRGSRSLILPGGERGESGGGLSAFGDDNLVFAGGEADEVPGAGMEFADRNLDCLHCYECVSWDTYRQVQVAISHDIAAGCGISPGNLYYHYANKEEIVRALFERSLEEKEDFQKTLEESDAKPEEKRVKGLEFPKEISWRYRFFKRELPALLVRDPALTKSFRAFHRRHLAELQRDIEQGMQFSGGRTLDTKKARWLAEISWLMVLFWPGFVEVGGARSTRKEMDRGMDLISWLFDRAIGNGKASIP